MGRPRKQIEERREASIRTDLTRAEKAYVKEQATRAALSEAEYTRRRVLGHAVVSPAGPRRADPALISELNRIGVNVNQLARAVHVGRDFVRHWREIGVELRTVLDKLLRAEED
jgi:hypothetical protein